MPMAIIPICPPGSIHSRVLSICGPENFTAPAAEMFRSETNKLNFLKVFSQAIIGRQFFFKVLYEILLLLTSY